MSLSNETTLLGNTKTYDNSHESYVIRLNDPKEGRLISSQGIKEIVIEIINEIFLDKALQSEHHNAIPAFNAAHSRSKI
jgi:hypothetical protein